MTWRLPDPIAVTMFSGGHGGFAIARRLLRTPGVDLSLVVNGYDNGLSTGALRRFLPGMLGPSDFRKNLLLHLDRDDPQQAALIAVLEHRLPAGSVRKDLDHLIGRIASYRGRDAGSAFTALAPRAREAITRDLRVLAHRLDTRPGGLDLADCALGNLVFAGAYLRLNEDFNAAVRSCVHTFGSPVRLLNVTNGENAFLVALKQDGRLLADEADIVAPQDAGIITDLFLLDEPITPARRAELESCPVEGVRDALRRHRAEITPNPRVRRAIEDADLIVYGPGTPHSSLLPSYLTPGIAEAITASRAAAKVFVVNIRDDHDVQGLSAPDLVDRTLSYLGDPRNERCTISHVLCHTPPAGTRPAIGPSVPSRVRESGERAGARWVLADLADPARPGVHSGRRTVDALTAIHATTSLARLR